MCWRRRGRKFSIGPRSQPMPTLPTLPRGVVGRRTTRSRTSLTELWAGTTDSGSVAEVPKVRGFSPRTDPAEGGIEEGRTEESPLKSALKRSMAPARLLRLTRLMVITTAVVWTVTALILTLVLSAPIVGGASEPPPCLRNNEEQRGRHYRSFRGNWWLEVAATELETVGTDSPPTPWPYGAGLWRRAEETSAGCPFFHLVQFMRPESNNNNCCKEAWTFPSLRASTPPHLPSLDLVNNFWDNNIIIWVMGPSFQRPFLTHLQLPPDLPPSDQRNWLTRDSCVFSPRTGWTFELCIQELLFLPCEMPLSRRPGPLYHHGPISMTESGFQRDGMRPKRNSGLS